MRYIFIFFCSILLCINAERTIINCNKNKIIPLVYRSIYSSGMQDYIKSATFNNCKITQNINAKIYLNNIKDAIFNNCEIDYVFSEFKELVFNKCRFHGRISITDSNTEIYNSEIYFDPESEMGVLNKDAYIYFSSHCSGNMGCYTNKFDIYGSLLVFNSKTGKRLYDKHISIYSDANSVGAIKSYRYPSCEENNVYSLDEKIQIYDEKLIELIPHFTKCVPCSESFYSTDSTECRECIAGNSWDKDTSSCIPCLFPERCPDPFTCKYPYKGISCTTCEKGFFMLNNDCRKCPESTGFIIGILIGFVITLIIGFFFYKFSTVWIDELVILTVSITHFQILTLITDFSIQFPQWFKEILNIIKSFFIDILKNYLINTECITEFNYVENYYFYAMLPFVGYVFIISSIYIYYSIKKKDHNTIVNSIIKLTYTLINTLYVYQLSYSLRIFNVIEIHDTIVLNDNRDIKRSSKEWQGMMAFAFFYFLYSLITPYLFFRKNQEKLDFLEKKLKKGCINYEIIYEIYGKKLLISCWMQIPIVLVSHILIFVSLISAIVIHNKLKPYVDVHNVENKMVNLFYALEILYLLMETCNIFGLFKSNTLSAILGIIYLISFLIIGVQLLKIFYKKIKIWLENRKKNKNIV